MEAATMDPAETFRECSRCHRTKGIEEYSPIGGERRHSWCLDCKRETQTPNPRAHATHVRVRPPRRPLRELVVPCPHRSWDRRYAHVDDAQLLCLIFHTPGMTIAEVAYQLSTQPARARRRIERLGDLVDRDPLRVNQTGLTYLRNRSALDPIQVGT